MLQEVIGTPAMLEQTAEECIELAHACLKLARYLRGENKVYKTKEEIYSNLSEEIADAYICIDELLEAGVISHESIDSNIMSKLERMRKRLEENGNE